MINKKIKEYLDTLNKDENLLLSFHGEYLISKEIKNLLSKEENYQSSKEDMAEQMAFDFLADYRNEESGWGTYYGPMFVLPNDQGQMVEYPSIRRIDNEIIEYWTLRAKETSNPLLTSRYADLVIDFSKEILSKNADVSLIRIVINSNINISKKSLADPLDCKTKLKRALLLSIIINDKELVNNVKDELIKLENKIAKDDNPGLWGFSFKYLLLDFKDKVFLSDQEKINLIKDLEDRLIRVEKNSWLVESVVSLLAEYYASEKDEVNLMRVLSILENSLKTDVQTNSDALIKTHSYEKIYEIYRKYENRFQKISESSKRVLQEIGSLDLDWNKSLKEISVETKIEQKTIDDILIKIFGDNENKKTLNEVLANIAISFLPKKNNVETKFKEFSAKNPMQFLCTTQVISDDGILIAKLSTAEEDYDNHFKKYASDYIQYGSFFLSLAIDEMKKRFSKEEIFNYFKKSILFEKENEDYLNRAICSYWDNDYIVSSHMFNPLIESAIRELVKISGGIILKPNDKTNGYDRVLLSALLKNDDIFKNVFSNSGHNILFYFRLVLVEKLGMNLRNDFAHGFGKNKFFGRNASDRLFHILIFLSFVVKKYNSNS